MDKAIISVVIASYNGAEFLQEQLDSIKNQTLPPDELIICDDRSNDDDKYMLGRFTELILVHFAYFVDKVTIE